MTAAELHPARRMWHLTEPLHAVLYYSPQAFGRAALLGLDVTSRWPSYFAWRAAPLGAVGAKVVTSAFYSFSPATVADYVPGVWAIADPRVVLSARLHAVDETMRHLIGDELGTPELTEAAKLAVAATEHAAADGHSPLAAANLDLPWPDEPHLALWQALTVLREHRGDGHLTALRHAGLDGCEALVSFAAVGAAPAATFASRGWSEAEWAAAQERLLQRGLVARDGLATAEGRALREHLERQTDELASGPWRALGPSSGRLAQLLQPILAAVLSSGLLPRESTLGIGKRLS